MTTRTAEVSPQVYAVLAASYIFGMFSATPALRPALERVGLG